MTDRLGEALDTIETASPETLEGTKGVFLASPTLDQVLEVIGAARNWQTLTNPTDELIERVVQLLRELIEKAKRSATDPEWEGSLDATIWTLAIIDALTVTAEEEK